MDYKEKVIALLNSQELSKEQKEKLEYIFPELKESEDEKIRKALIDIIKGEHSGTFPRKGFSREEYIAYLEKRGEQKQEETWPNLSNCLHDCKKCTGKCFYRKEKYQGEQKPADKVEPKFNVGDWITNGDYTWKIVEVKPLNYILQSQDCNIVDDTISYVDRQFHSFTIQDAKDGDVLCTYECDEPKIVFILKGTPKKHYALSYHCYYNIMYPRFESDSEKGCLAPNDEDVKPATKEQRDQLEKVMADAGYTFDFEKKELKKIEQKPAEWSEEDETNIGRAIDIIKDAKEGLLSYKTDDGIYECEQAIKVLDKLLKNGYSVLWKEADYDNIEKLIKILPQCIFRHPHILERDECLKLVSWLKSLKERCCPQKHWKPSREQIEALQVVIEHGVAVPDREASLAEKHLEELLEQIKTL